PRHRPARRPRPTHDRGLAGWSPGAEWCRPLIELVFAASLRRARRINTERIRAARTPGYTAIDRDVPVTESDGGTPTITACVWCHSSRPKGGETEEPLAPSRSCRGGANEAEAPRSDYPTQPTR